MPEGLNQIKPRHSIAPAGSQAGDSKWELCSAMECPFKRKSSRVSSSWLAPTRWRCPEGSSCLPWHTYLRARLSRETSCWRSCGSPREWSWKPSRRWLPRGPMSRWATALPSRHSSGQLLWKQPSGASGRSCSRSAWWQCWGRHGPSVPWATVSHSPRTPAS